MGRCGKRRYRDQIAALLALEKIKNRSQVRAKTPTRAYPCPSCSGWHLTSKKK